MNRAQAAQYALLVMYAWDMCDRNLKNLAPSPDVRLTAAGWTIRGYLTASDDIIKSGSKIRSALLGASSGTTDRVCYGYIAERTQADGSKEYAIAVRGTDGAEEWADDLDFLMEHHPVNGAGLVDQGFYEIYKTMQAGPDAKGQQPPAAAIRAIVGTSPVMVAGHSLGAALATYLVLDLKLAGLDASACLFASPRTGDQNFVDYFEATVDNYDLFNYARDVVPTVPEYDVLHLSRYRDLCQMKTIPPGFSGAQIDDNPTCNHHLICYVSMLDPDLFKLAVAAAKAGQVQDDLNCASCVKGYAS